MASNCAILFLIFAITVEGVEFINHTKVVACHWGTWSIYGEGNYKFDHKNIDGDLCTHLIYSFVGLNEAESSLRSLDPW